MNLMAFSGINSAKQSGGPMTNRGIPGALMPLECTIRMKRRSGRTRKMRIPGALMPLTRTIQMPRIEGPKLRNAEENSDLRIVRTNTRGENQRKT